MTFDFRFPSQVVTFLADKNVDTLDTTQDVHGLKLNAETSEVCSLVTKRGVYAMRFFLKFLRSVDT